MDDEDFLRKLREAFSVEAEEHVQAMTSKLLELEKTAEPDRRQKIIEAIFREAHSLKGAARAVNRIDIEAVCQGLEGVFAHWKREGATVLPETFDALNRALDFVEKLRVQASDGTSTEERNAVQEWVRQIKRLTAPGRSRARSAASTPTPTAVLEQTPEPPPVPSVSVPGSSKPPPPEPATVATEPQHLAPERLSPAETVRVPLAKMDALLLQAEEMVAVKLVARQQVTELREIGARLGAWRKEWMKVRRATSGTASSGSGGTGKRLQEFLEWNESQIDAIDKSVDALARSVEHDERLVTSLVDDLLADAKQLVMLPFARLLDLMPKLVRDLSREEGKEVELVLRGSEVEIDKRILEEMKAPLIHLVRNSIDHGLEKPAVRVQRGKMPHGLLSIAVSQRDGNKIEMVVSDDGGGIDVERVKASAVKNNLIGAAEAQRLGEADALALIFQSGVSASPILTEISGRGLGMAIVREKIDKLGGQIAIESKPREGTSFRMLLPVTLATFKGILVSAGGETFVVPTASVERIKGIKRDEIQTVENRETISYAGRVLALAWLADVLELPRVEPANPRSPVEVVIIGAGEQQMAFAVESVINEQEVLVKNLGKPLIRVRNIAGATVLGSGAPVLILNVLDLLKSAVRLAAIAAAPARSGTTEKEERAYAVLVADDSVTSRMLLKNILESAGYRVTTAIDGVEAFTTLRNGEFDVVVSDVEMPRMDGFELTAKIRADKKCADLPVVLVTALNSREHQERGVDVGANAYIVKSSFDQSNLLEVIRRLV